MEANVQTTCLGKKRRATTMLPEIDDCFIDIISPPSKKRKLYHAEFVSKFTIQHFIALHCSISSYQFNNQFPSYLIYLEIIPFLSKNIDPQFQFIYQRYTQFRNNLKLVTFNKFLNSFKCEFCQYLFNTNGFIGCNDFLCDDCNKLYCDSKCYYNEDHIFKCNKCNFEYCKIFYDENYWNNDVRKCKGCEEFMCMQCYNKEGDIVCNDCDDFTEEKVFRTDVAIDRRNLEQRFDILQHYDLSGLDDEKQEIDTLIDQSYDDVHYGERMNCCPPFPYFMWWWGIRRPGTIHCGLLLSKAHRNS